MKKIYFTKEKIYFIPSYSHKSLKHKNHLENKPLNMGELTLQGYDSENGVYVNDLKDFNIGDKILFVDVIKDIYYKPKDNATYFVFRDRSTNNDVKWGFKGDLTNKFMVGDTLELKFNVVEEYRDENITFETIDYFKEAMQEIDKSIFPDITKYLKNKF